MLDLGSGSGEMLCTWARDYGAIGIDMSQLYTEQAKLRAAELGVADQVKFIHGDALGSVRQLTNSSGAVSYTSAYDPYGVTTQTSGISQTAYGYTNEYSGWGVFALMSR